MWSVEYHPTAVGERADLPSDMRARLARMSDVIEDNGFSNLPRDWVKSLGDKLWELRITGKDGIARAIYVTSAGRRVVIVRIFIKKTQKTPQRELELARQREGGQMKTVKAKHVHAKDMAKDPAYRAAYRALENEFALVRSLIKARTRADLSQAEVAARMGTTESAVSRLESGRAKPTTRTLERYAKATGHRLHISLEPASK